MLDDSQLKRVDALAAQLIKDGTGTARQTTGATAIVRDLYERIKSWRTAGITWPKIATLLNQAGIGLEYGQPWKAHTLRSLWLSEDKRQRGLGGWRQQKKQRAQAAAAEAQASAQRETASRPQAQQITPTGAVAPKNNRMSLIHPGAPVTGIIPSRRERAEAAAREKEKL